MTKRPLWLAVAGTLRQDFGVITRVTAITTAVAVGLSLVWPKTYTATAAFIAESPPDLSASSRVGALVASTGLFSLRSGEQSPQFYASLLVSREVIERVLELPMGPAAGDSTNRVLDYLEVKGEGRKRIDEAVKLLRDRTSAEVNDRTGTVRIWVDDRSPDVAAYLVQSLLRELDAFNVVRRRARAVDEDQFVQTRLDEARARMDSSRAALTTFYQTNRMVDAPALRSREQELNQELSLRQAHVADLQQAAFQVGLEVVRSTPSITILEHPVPPSRKSKPKRTLVVILTFVLTGLLMLSYRTARDELRDAWVQAGRPRS